MDRRRQYLPIVTRVLLGYWTGGRLEAIDALLWRDVDLGRSVLVFPSSKGRRVVCLLEPVLASHLRELHAARRPSPDELVLLAPRTRRAAVTWRAPWSRLLAVANHRLEPEERIPSEAPLHVLRHSRITHLLVAGVAAQVVAQVTGTSLAMLQRHYAHAVVGSLERELERGPGGAGARRARRVCPRAKGARENATPIETEP